LSSSVWRWPDRGTVDGAARGWAAAAALVHPGTIAIGYFGSYARGDAGAGSDLDIVAIVDRASRPFAERPLDWSLHDLPVQADLVVYTREEWLRPRFGAGRFRRTLDEETVWIWGAPPTP
jgi:predicted nucleotidyltransferase